MEKQIIDLCESDGGDSPSTVRNSSFSSRTGAGTSTKTDATSLVPKIGRALMSHISIRNANVSFGVGDDSDSDLDSIPSASGFSPNKPIQKPRVNENKDDVIKLPTPDAHRKENTMCGDGLHNDETHFETENKTVEGVSSSQWKGTELSPVEKYHLKEFKTSSVAERKNENVDLIELYSSEEEPEGGNSRSFLSDKKEADPSSCPGFITNSKNTTSLGHSKVPFESVYTDDSDCLYSPSPFECKKSSAHLNKDISATREERKMAPNKASSKTIIVCDSDSNSDESFSPHKFNETMTRSDQLNQYLSKNIHIEKLTKSATSYPSPTSSRSFRQKKRSRQSSLDSSQPHSSYVPESDSGLQSRRQNQSSSEMNQDQQNSNFVSTPAIPVINQIGGKLYPDLRDQFIIALIQHARATRMAVYNKGVFDACIRSITIIALYPFPIRTAEVASNLRGIGKELLEVLKQSQKECKRKPFYPTEGKFSSVTAAALVSLLNYKEMEESDDFCPVEELITRINALVHNNRSGVLLPKEPAFYLKKQTLDPGWQQVCHRLDLLLSCLFCAFSYYPFGRFEDFAVQI